MKKSRELCIEERDFETAFEKWKSTTNRWKSYWFKGCEEIYNDERCGNKIKKKYIITETTIEIRKIEIEADAIYYNECEEVDTPKNAELLYVIVMRDEHDRAIYYKVGTTIRSINARMKEHLTYYYFEGIRNIEVNRVVDCGNIPAEGLESYLRAQLIKEHPTAFKKNDRFIAEEVVKLDLEKIDKWIAEYLG